MFLATQEATMRVLKPGEMPPKPPTVRRASKVRLFLARYGITPYQLLILRLLAATPGPLSLGMIADRFGISDMYTRRALGHSDPRKRAALEAREEVGYPSLLTLGMVKAEVFDVDGKVEEDFSITVAGRKKLAEPDVKAANPPRPKERGEGRSDEADENGST